MLPMNHQGETLGWQRSSVKTPMARHVDDREQEMVRWRVLIALTAGI
jgi:hypothetical protein